MRLDRSLVTDVNNQFSQVESSTDSNLVEGFRHIKNAVNNPSRAKLLSAAKKARALGHVMLAYRLERVATSPP